MAANPEFTGFSPFSDLVIYVFMPFVKHFIISVSKKRMNHQDSSFISKIFNIFAIKEMMERKCPEICHSA